jgi:thiol:disulfide interchange protein
MVKQIVSDTFETIGDTFQQTGRQVVMIPFQIGEETARQLGIRPRKEENQEKPEGVMQQPNQEVAKRNAFASRRIGELEAEIKAIVQKKTQEIPKNVSGKPGFSEENMVKQFETEKKEKDKLPPVVIAAKSKASAEKRQFGGG